mmetsp:Transcript_20944/g.65109  ORF Transcript_20944/g.65109 Transcript_20944/m.65109 type:complete len:248 (+) Transcript_20944:343-1086(+)
MRRSRLVVHQGHLALDLPRELVVAPRGRTRAQLARGGVVHERRLGVVEPPRDVRAVDAEARARRVALDRAVDVAQRRLEPAGGGLGDRRVVVDAGEQPLRLGERTAREPHRLLHVRRRRARVVVLLVRERAPPVQQGIGRLELDRGRQVRDRLWHLAYQHQPRRLLVVHLCGRGHLLAQCLRLRVRGVGPQRLGEVRARVGERAGFEQQAREEEARVGARVGCVGEIVQVVHRCRRPAKADVRECAM